ncbi:MAG: hypothetical protein WBI44_07065 [Syntrophaceticus sp.]|mgnify:CR=1 FL=1|uniref:Putative lipoprotein n=1 Tax=Syntrophaceticus schinkii TaxID=499207 RepID=A0A0B7MIT1_9FIRM|nr:hypothetical protein [Syntrophaceticus schinkii]MDD2360819.1 hypothetical protein [Syntrophaceticus schinkii]MDD4262592.1 hypothetical protein [Syntrophaceticus schinkii]CEO88123.1 putative lipoprotein [Syntrophaceticus schinkii]HHY30195.1 hypothetical protein [Syntrophaceticus sp.]
MNKKILVALIVILVLAIGTACYCKNKTTASPETPKQVETNNSDSSGDSNDSELVIKTDNRASEKEADEMLKEVDRQLDSLIKALDELDEVDTKELPDEEGN